MPATSEMDSRTLAMVNGTSFLRTLAKRLSVLFSNRRSSTPEANIAAPTSMAS